MHRMRSVVWLLTAAAMFFSAVSGHAASAGGSADAKAYLQDVYEEMRSLTSVHGDIAVDIKSPMASISTITKFDIQRKAEERLLRARTEAVFSLAGNGQRKMRLLQYARQDSQEITSYVHLGDRWTKRTINEAAAETAGEAISPVRLLKKVSFKDENETLAVLDAVIDVEKVSDLMEAFFKREQARLKEVPAAENGGVAGDGGKKRMQALFVKALRNMGDISYSVTVDKKSKRMVNLFVDMTEPLQRSARAAMEEMPLTDNEKAMLEFAVRNTRVFIQEDFSCFNQVKPFKIPAKVLENAVDAKVYEKETREKAKQAAS